MSIKEEEKEGEEAREEKVASMSIVRLFVSKLGLDGLGFNYLHVASR